MSRPSKPHNLENNEAPKHDSFFPKSYVDLKAAIEFETNQALFLSNETVLEDNKSKIDSFYYQYLGDHADNPVDHSMSNADSSDPELFKQLAIEEWDGEECFAWASSICRCRGLYTTEVNLWNFKNTTGNAMLDLSLQHFCVLAGDLYGSVLYRDFQNLRKGRERAKGHQPEGRTEDATNAKWLLAGAADLDFSSHSTSSFPSTPSSSVFPSTLSIPSSSPPSSPTINTSSFISSLITDSLELSTEEFLDLDKYIPRNEVWSTLPEDLLDVDLTSYLYSEKDEYEDAAYDAAEDFPQQATPFSSEISCSNPTQKIKTNTRKGARNPKIWEFLMRLLVDSETNPKLIRWDDKSKATFVLSQPAIIAKLWGARSKKPNLSANNFARALRYHYNTGAIIMVSEKHYMYKCGPKSLQYLLEIKNDSPSSE